MSNINVKKRLESVSADLAKIAHHIALYGGIDAKEARYIDTLSTDIAETAAMVAAEARSVGGNTSGKTLVKGVRKALGYSKP